VLSILLFLFASLPSPSILSDRKEEASLASNGECKVAVNTVAIMEYVQSLEELALRYCLQIIVLPVLPHTHTAKGREREMEKWM
jgi:imidazole glycerol phosphate synthase subunit HisF